MCPPGAVDSLEKFPYSGGYSDGGHQKLQKKPCYGERDQQRERPTREGGTHGAPAFWLGPKHTSSAGTTPCLQSHLSAVEVFTKILSTIHCRFVMELQ